MSGPPRLETRFSGRPVVITGGSSGIGLRLAEDLLRAGARVTIVSNDAPGLDAALRRLRGVAAAVDAVPADVSRLDEVRRMVASCLERSGPPAVLVNGAGCGVYRTFDESPAEESAGLLAVNLLGAMYCTREFLPAMIRAGGGRIVNIASVAGAITITPNAVYCAAKHGMIAWSRAIRAELAEQGVRVHVVCPGRVETAFFDHETFRTRTRTRETRAAVPVEQVSRGIIAAIERDRFLTFIPRRLGLAAWLVQAFPWPAGAALDWVLRRRIRVLRQDRGRAAPGGGEGHGDG